MKGNRGGRGYPKPREAKFCDCGDHAWTQLTRGYVVLVSPEDAEILNLRAFVAKVTARAVYATSILNGASTRAAFQRSVLYVHRLVMPEVHEVDHKNGNGLDCRRENLRAATRSQTRANSRKRSDSNSQYKGVHKYLTRCKREPRWCASVNKDGKVFKSGSFLTELEAAEAYTQWSVEAFGEFASSRV